MSYDLTFAIALGPAKAGLSLRARLVDTAGQAVGDEAAAGFVEIGGGNYLWTGQLPDGFRGAVKFHEAGSPAPVLAAAAVNPEEVQDVWTRDVDSTGAGLPAAKALEVILAVLAGKAEYDGATGAFAVKGRDGLTTVATVTLSGAGCRSGSEIA